MYAREIRAVRLIDESATVTPIGRLVLDLPAQSAVRWLLALETAQSNGWNDDWRLSRSSAVALLQNTEWGGSWGDEETEARLPASWMTIQRLSQLGILRVFDSRRGTFTCQLVPEGRPLLEEIAGGESTPFSLLAEALLHDETAAVVGQFSGLASRIQRDGAAAATARHARMVAHEIRNALVPVQVTLDTFYAELQREGIGAHLAAHRDTIDTGIARIFRFVKEMVSATARGVEPAELFSVWSAIDDAIAAITAEFGARISFELPRGVINLKGSRSRFTLAMANLLRNAVQARPDGRIEVRAEEAFASDLHEIILTVDDSGPGVPSEYREAIFRRGFSRRPGGTGEGLALVREVVESELRGRVSCETSPLGGARLVLRLPVNGKGTGE
jgi:signal transduction histidine kinase